MNFLQDEERSSQQKRQEEEVDERQHSHPITTKNSNNNLPVKEKQEQQQHQQPRQRNNNIHRQEQQSRQQQQAHQQKERHQHQHKYESLSSLLLLQQRSRHHAFSMDGDDDDDIGHDLDNYSIAHSLESSSSSRSSHSGDGGRGRASNTRRSRSRSRSRSSARLRKNIIRRWFRSKCRRLRRSLCNNSNIICNTVCKSSMEYDSPRAIILGLSGLILLGAILGLSFPSSSSDSDSSSSTSPPTSSSWETLSNILGYTYFLSWTLSFYPQILTNIRHPHKAKQGVSLDFVVWNIVGFACYAIYVTSFRYSDVVRREYAERFGEDDSATDAGDASSSSSPSSRSSTGEDDTAGDSDKQDWGIEPNSTLVVGGTTRGGGSVIAAAASIILWDALVSGISERIFDNLQHWNDERRSNEYFGDDSTDTNAIFGDYITSDDSNSSNANRTIHHDPASSSNPDDYDDNNDGSNKNITDTTNSTDATTTNDTDDDRENNDDIIHNRHNGEGGREGEAEGHEDDDPTSSPAIATPQVQTNDVAFAWHALFLTLVIFFQITWVGGRYGNNDCDDGCHGDCGGNIDGDSDAFNNNGGWLEVEGGEDMPIEEFGHNSLLSSSNKSGGGFMRSALDWGGSFAGDKNAEEQIDIDSKYDDTNNSFGETERNNEEGYLITPGESTTNSSQTIRHTNQQLQQSHLQCQQQHQRHYQKAEHKHWTEQISPITKIFISVLLFTFIVGAVFVATDLDTGIWGGGKWQWIDYLYFLSFVKVGITIIKYIPQVLLNYQRKSTSGWQIWNIILDFTGGMLSILQLVGDSVAQAKAQGLDNGWTGIVGNPAKLGLGLVSIFFDIIFMLQHYALYPKEDVSTQRQPPHHEDGGPVTQDDTDFNSFSTPLLSTSQITI